MTEAYRMGGQNGRGDPDTQRSGPGSFRRQIDAVKEAARIEEVAGDYGEFKLAGAGRLLGRCISPDHSDRTPSMTIYVDEQRFRCFGLGCGAHGDVLDLVMLAEPDLELWEAMVSLATRYGIQLPERPGSWFARQKRQAPVRDAIEEALIEHFARRLFRCMFVPSIEQIEDEGERREETDLLWDACVEIAILWRASVLEERRAS